MSSDDADTDRESGLEVIGSRIPNAWSVWDHYAVPGRDCDAPPSALAARHDLVHALYVVRGEPWHRSLDVVPAFIGGVPRPGRHSSLPPHFSTGQCLVGRGPLLRTPFLASWSNTPQNKLPSRSTSKWANGTGNPPSRSCSSAMSGSERAVSSPE